PGWPTSTSGGATPSRQASCATKSLPSSPWSPCCPSHRDRQEAFLQRRTRQNEHERTNLCRGHPLSTSSGSNQPMTGKIIFINGASSAGKSTLCQALQVQLAEPFWHVSIDHFIS